MLRYYNNTPAEAVKAAEHALDAYDRTPTTERWSAAMAEERVMEVFFRVKRDESIARSHAYLGRHVDDLEHLLPFEREDYRPEVPITLVATTPIANWGSYVDRTREILAADLPAKSEDELFDYAKNLERRMRDIPAITYAFEMSALA